MKKLSDSGIGEEIVNRINSLTPTRAAVWGKMNVNQMLVHCRLSLENALGKQLSRSLVGLLFGSIAKKNVLTDKPVKRNLPTDKRFFTLQNAGFEQERKNLKDTVNRFLQAGPGGLSADPHPFFGKMTPDQWNILMWKHLDHHLRQFGA